MIGRLLRWLRSARSHAEQGGDPPLRGVPQVRRLKTYAAETGYSWSYFYEGYRVHSKPLPARHFEFTLHRGSVSPQTMVVAVPDTVVSALAETAGRALGAPEVYALAKMLLFSVLDAEVHPASNAPFSLNAEEAHEIWARLDL